MSVYIQSASNISIQNTFQADGFPEPVWYTQPYVRCIDPDIKSFISPIESRRMSKVIKRAIAVSKSCIAASGIEKPDAIISGTGLGCIEDTEKFLNAMIDNKETLLQPTYFIQSTHNTISSQVAINLKCHGHNNTFVHGGVSFECALMEALLLFNNKKIKTALVGGHDEMTPAYFQLLNQTGLWKKEIPDVRLLCESTTPGSFSSEGNTSFMLSDTKTDSSWAEISGLELHYQPENIETLIENFLQRMGKTPDDIDIVLLGINGDVDGNATYKRIANTLFSEKTQAWYKHFSGEFFTSSAFGLWIASLCLKNKNLPDYLNLNKIQPKEIKNVLMVNHYQNKDYSLILTTSC